MNPSSVEEVNARDAALGCVDAIDGGEDARAAYGEGANLGGDPATQAGGDEDASRDAEERADGADEPFVGFGARHGLERGQVHERPDTASEEDGPLAERERVLGASGRTGGQGGARSHPELIEPPSPSPSGKSREGPGLGGPSSVVNGADAGAHEMTAVGDGADVVPRRAGDDHQRQEVLLTGMGGAGEGSALPLDESSVALLAG